MKAFLARLLLAFGYVVAIGIVFGIPTVFLVVTAIGTVSALMNPETRLVTFLMLSGLLVISLAAIALTYEAKLTALAKGNKDGDE